MRFFDTNWLFSNFGGTYSASSGFPLLAFNEDNKFAWSSSGENTDGDAIFVERVLANSAKIDRIFIKDTNISNLTIQVDLGSGYVALSGFTLTKSNDGKNYFYELNSTINIFAIKVIGSNTIIANQNKQIKQILSFTELGVIKHVDDINPKRMRVQKISKLNSGKVDIINKGHYYSFQIKLKTHYNAVDNSIIEKLLNRDEAFYFWINNDNEDSMVMLQEPYRFNDIYKVAIQGDDNLSFNRNLFFSGIDETINLVEVP